MNLRPARASHARRRQSGLTLVEIIVTTALLLFITLGLTAMFTQTSRAFKSGVKQVDVLEGGRAALAMIARDIEQASAGHSQLDTNFAVAIPAGSIRTVSSAPDGSLMRTNYLQDVFLLSYTTNWNGIGYRVLHPDPNRLDSMSFVGVGTLYRFSTNAMDRYPNQFWETFLELPSRQAEAGSLRRVIDGVIHLYVRPLDAAGQVMTNPIPGQVDVRVTPTVDDEHPVFFKGSALPVMVEIELAVFEPPAYQQLKPLLFANPTAAQEFIQRNGGKVHVFRQQVPIRPARQ